MQLVKLVSEVNRSSLASIKTTISEIIDIIHDPRSSVRKLTQLIELDPPLSARILKVANSPYYASSRQIDDIKYAIIRIGYNEVKSLALSQKVFELFDKDLDFENFTLLDLWKHSIATALLAKTIYRNEFREGGENIYAAGLMHDVGLIVASQFLTDEFAAVLHKRNEHRGSIIAAENEVMGYNHQTIALHLLRDWQMPDELVEAVAHHHQPGKVNNEFSRAASTLYVAVTLVQREQMGFCDMPVENRYLFEKHLHLLKLSQRSADMIVDQTKREMQKMETEGWF